MRLLEVLIEHKVQSLNRPFSYTYKGDKPVDEGFRVLVTFNRQTLVGYVLKARDITEEELEEIQDKKGFDILEIFDVLDDKPLLNKELMDLAVDLSDYYFAPMIAVLQTMLPPSLKPASSSLKAPKVAYEKWIHLKSDDETDLTPKQIEFLRYLKENGDIPKRLTNSPSILGKLLEAKRVVIYDREKQRYSIPEIDKENKKILTKEQEAAVESILSTDKVTSLLYGVTGSGKTEIYLKLAEKMIFAGKNVLMLVPEIGLTPIMIEYFERRFAGKVAVLHSDLTPAQKYDEYRKIARGECQIVVGARSAIFAPLDNIGLIIIDEEHSESYKQDNTPMYSAKTVAQFRAKKYGAKVVLGSATPSLDSMSRAKAGIYNLITLKNRINKHPLPDTEIVDISKGENLSRKSYMFSNILIEKLEAVLSKGEQAILLINRRGYAPYVNCRNCGHIFTCPTCGSTLTLHKKSGQFKCHKCGYVEEHSDTCPVCGSTSFLNNGFGTEKIAEEVTKLFPNARVLRLDSDVSEIRNNTQQILNKFKHGYADILIGTQMVAKGHDFPNVTLVSVVQADVGLSIPSFRATERVFQLITQSVGRSGRADKEGCALVQTYHPENFAIQLGAAQDYENFYKLEMKNRELQKYPPFYHLIGVDVASKDFNNVYSFIKNFINEINRLNDKSIVAIGPVKPYIMYQNEFHHRVVFIKYKNRDRIIPYLRKTLDLFKNKSEIKLRIDVDPYN